MAVCNICPRMCGIDRSVNVGMCGAEDNPFVARAALHHWEEPPISGTNGSGAVFFCGCNMRCVFCQNHEISVGHVGRQMDAEALCEVYFALQSDGAHNINLVTPTPHTKLLASSIKKAKEKGITIPFVWNTNAYELVDTLKMLEGLVDIYLPDLKYVSAERAREYSGTENYFDYAAPAILEMYRQVGTLQIQCGIAMRGLIIRHLILPNNVDESRRVLDWIADHLPMQTQISLMRQYTPMHRVRREPQKFKHLQRKITSREYDRAIDYALSLGLQNVFIQGAKSANDSFTPLFDGTVL